MPTREPDAFTVRTAAELLSEDPAITITERDLFTRILALGWASRWTHGYRPTEVAVGLVDVIPARAGRDIWDQLVITHRGLALLHATIRGQSPDLTDDLEETLA